MKHNLKQPKAFTIIELIVVISIISILSAIVIINIQHTLAKARDAKRLSDMATIQKALELYKIKNGQYPNNADSDCLGWDIGNKTESAFISSLVPEFLGVVPTDPTQTDICKGYRYYKYPAGTLNCDISKGAFYVLEISDLETYGTNNEISPGWSCPSRDWGTDGNDWVTGSFEK